MHCGAGKGLKGSWLGDFVGSRGPLRQREARIDGPGHRKVNSVRCGQNSDPCSVRCLPKGLHPISTAFFMPSPGGTEEHAQKLFRLFDQRQDLPHSHAPGGDPVFVRIVKGLHVSAIAVVRLDLRVIIVEILGYVAQTDLDRAGGG